MREILMPALLALTMLAGCSAPPPRPDLVRERIGDELAQAATQRKSGETAERALLMPLTVELPQQADNGGGEMRFDLSIVNAPAAQVFSAIVTGTRYNMLVGPEVSGTITVNLKDVTVREALEAIRELYGYEFNIKGNRISIQPNTLQTRVFQVNYLAMQRGGHSNLTVGSGTQSGSGSSQPGAGGQQNVGGMVGTNSTPSSGIGSQQAQGSYDPSGSHVNTDNSIDFWGELQRTLLAIVTTPDQPPQPGQGTPMVVVNKVSGSVLVKARPRDLRLVEEYLSSSKLVVQRQVMLEAKIVEVRLSEGTQNGINWGSFSGSKYRFSAGVAQPNTLLRTTPGSQVETKIPFSTDASGRYDDIISSKGTVIPGLSGLIASAAGTALGNGFVGLAFQSANFAALLNFLETQGTLSVLSSPRVATLNNQKAVLKVGKDEVYVTGFTVNTSNQTVNGVTEQVTTPAPQTSRLFSGISLDVTPQIDEDGNIVLHVHPAISDVDEVPKTFNLGSAGIIQLPIASRSVNETDSIVRVQDGNIVAIGGMMHQVHDAKKSGLPGTLNSGGGLSALTGQKESRSYKSEMVILLKPTIIQDDRSWQRDLEQSAERVRNFGLPPVSVPVQ